MKSLLNFRSLIRVAIIMAVMAFMAGQVTDTYASGWGNYGLKRFIRAIHACNDRNCERCNPGGNTDDCSEACEGLSTKLDVIEGKIDEIDCGNGNPPDPGECPGAVPKTGQTISQGDRDDGELEAGVAWPVPRFTVVGQSTVKDNLTCLIWDINANRFGDQTWDNALIACNTSTVGGHNDWRLPNLFELESLRHMGAFDPAVPDTLGTGKSSQGDPFSGLNLFNGYWSSTRAEAGGTSLFAWDVVFTGGYVDVTDMDDLDTVWCVRDGS